MTELNTSSVPNTPLQTSVSASDIKSENRVLSTARASKSNPQINNSPSNGRLLKSAISSSLGLKNKTNVNANTFQLSTPRGATVDSSNNNINNKTIKNSGNQKVSVVLNSATTSKKRVVENNNNNLEDMFSYDI